ncbi:MAG: DNA polymerase/3'-5' exonuclease PolX [Phycisphaerae bacterium]|nr:DNA polymerase/3'-5' exonuclease PolX [Phycisphaerae bacterium]
MTNADVARQFEEIADLMEIRGDDAFRVNAYRKIARTVEDLAADINDLAARNELAGLPGVGKASIEKIRELLSTGKLALRDELLAEVPAGLLGLRQIQGLGPKKIAQLWRERGIDSIDALKTALASNALAGLKGFADKSIDNIRRGLDFLATAVGRTRLGIAWEIAEQFKQQLRKVPGVQRIEHAGSLRRGVETVGDIDLLCIADDGAKVVQAFTKLADPNAILASGDTKGSIRFSYADDRAIQVDLRVVPAASYGAALQYFSGSKAHNVRLREMAVKRGWSLNEYGLHEGETQLAGANEEDIYAKLGLPWMPPELREDRGEFELRETPADLIDLADIRGDLHMHTTASDGRCTIEQMIEGAAARGYQYICITDHSRSSFVANGLTIERLKAHIDDVRAAAAKTKNLTVWVGAEVDILSEGELDYPDDMLAQLDFVVASLHAGMSQDVKINTNRTLRAIQNPYVNLIAHPTGRMINRREAMPLDLETLAAAAAETGTAMEINASNFRLDLKDQHARFVRDRGVTICIDCDAHHADQFDQMRFGVMTARRAWLRKADVLNTRPAAEIQAFVAAKRKKLGVG